MNVNETYRVASTDLETKYEYTNETIAINGTHHKDGNNQLNSLRGDVSAIGGGAVGSFSGYRRGASMMYDFSSIESSHLVDVAAAAISLETLAVAGEGNSQEGGEA